MNLTCKAPSLRTTPILLKGSMQATEGRKQSIVSPQHKGNKITTMTKIARYLQ